MPSSPVSLGHLELLDFVTTYAKREKPRIYGDLRLACYRISQVQGYSV